MSINSTNFNGAVLTTEIRPQSVSQFDNLSIRQSTSSSPSLYQGTGNYYEFVAVGGDISWEDARNQAAARTYEGRQGYLVTITSSGEQEFLQGLLAGSNVWLGGSDAATEGDWRWVTGPEGLANNGAGTSFWSGGVSGQPVSGSYVNWSNGEPNDANNGNPSESEDSLMMIGSSVLVNENRTLGSWNDFPNAGGVDRFRPQGFIVEYGGLPGDVVPVTESINDLYWRNYTSGDNRYWEISSSIGEEGGLTINTTVDNLLTQLPGKEWAMDLVADFNGDGQSDIFFHNYTTGETQVWLLQKNATSGEVSRIGSAIDLIQIPEADWRIVGAADFNNDDVTDIVWRNQTTGKNAIWLMGSNGNNSSITAGFFIESDAPSEWSIESVADIDGNGKYDFVWRNSSNGDLAIWEMTYDSQMNLPAAASAGTPPVVAANASENPFSRTNAYFLGVSESVGSVLSAVADFNGDNILDFVWHNDATGVAKIWTLAANNGVISRGIETILSPNTGTNSGWEIAGVGQLNQDTTPDLIWRNYLTGDNAAWTVNYSAEDGISFGTAALFGGTIETDWVIEAVETHETTASVA